MSELVSSPGPAAPRPPSIRGPHARRRAVGAEVSAQGVHFRTWAPDRRSVEVVIEGEARAVPLVAEPDGFWAGFAPGLRAGARYRFRLDEAPTLLPDPASRYQPDGPHEASEVIDPSTFAWTDQDWRGVDLAGQVIYELHVGTFTPEGTYRAAAERLPDLRALGVTVVELMPLAEFPGRFGWGYDGVDLFAPFRLYGRPDDLRAFVDRAHALGIAVVLDVVYNHFGPSGNYLDRFSPCYFSEVDTEWGRAVNYDGAECVGARTLVLENVAYWIEEFHLDGLRLDATQSIFDSSADHLVAAIGRGARAAAPGRSVIVIAENEPNDARLVQPPEAGGFGLDGVWNDDFHHAAVVAATGRAEAYYSDYRGTAREFLAAARYGYLYQGQRYHWQKQRRGRPARGVAPLRFVCCLENHDQVANSLRGERLWQQSSPGRHRALTGLLLLGPWTPMLFQGQEWNASTPFTYFADHEPELAEKVKAGRAEFLSQFPGCGSPEGRRRILDPAAPDTFERARLRWEERSAPPHADALRLHTDLLALRRSDPTLAAAARGRLPFDGAVLGEHCLALRYFGEDEAQDRLLVVNLGLELSLTPAPEPLLAPPQGTRWSVAWASEAPAYGGIGAFPPEDEGGGWRVQGESAFLLCPAPATARDAEA